MAWKQLRDANWRVPYVGGWCLKYVQDAFGTDHPDPDATNAWNDNYGNGNHYDLPPVGKTVPVYFSLGNVPQGHVAISLDDGMVASSTQGGSHPQGYLHPNLNDLIAIYGRYNGGCHYLGWSEFVGTVRVVENATPMVTTAQVNELYQTILERSPDVAGLTHFVGHYTYDFVKADLLASGERKTLLSNKAAAILAKLTADKEAARLAEVTRLAEITRLQEIARLAEVARLKAIADAKAIQDAKDAETARIAAEKAKADAIVEDNTQFTSWLKNLFIIIGKFLTSWRK